MAKRSEKSSKGDPRLKREIVGPREGGQRLDIYMIGVFDGLSRKQAKKLIDQSKVSVNGKIEIMASHEVVPGERIEVRFDPPEEKKKPPVIKLLYRDEHFLAVDKPSSIPSGVTMDPGRLTAELLAKKAFGAKLKLLHRLDRDTTGVLLFGINDEATRSILEEFRKRMVDKTYFAIVSGKPPEKFDDVRHIKEVPGGRVASVASGGMRTETSFTTLAVANGCALVECRPKTGRMHQIRLQLSARGFPILGDALYGGAPRVRIGEEELEIPRQMLHAYKVAFNHPANGSEMEITSPIPEDFERIAKALFGVVSVLKKSKSRKVSAE